MCSTQAWAAKVAFNIPAGQAQQTLRDFYLQSRVAVLYLTDNVKGVETRAVVGELEASEALGQLLHGTGLSFEFISENSAVIKPTPTSASVRETDADPSPGSRPQVAPILDSEHEMRLQEVLVTGSLIHGVFDITSPLIELNRSKVRSAPYGTVQDTVRTLPLAASITRGEVLGGTGNYGFGSSINLRGLGEGATLALVNGRRQPASGLSGDFVDVSTIPWSMVDRVEVLPDGGSALYGSDAIAGVVNIILRQNLEGAETQLRYGNAEGGAVENVLSQLFGHHWEGGHWFAGYQYSKRSALAANDRRYARSADKRELGGRDHRRVTANPGNILDPQTLQPLFAIPQGQDGRSLSADDLLPGVVNYHNQFAGVELLPDIRKHNVYFTASQNLSEHLTVFAEGRYAQRDFRKHPYVPDGGPFVVPATNPFFVDPFGGAPFVVVAYDFTKDFGRFEYGGRVRNYSGALGLQAELPRAWRASLTGSYGREQLTATDSGIEDAYALPAALADPNPDTALNPFGDGSHTNPATLDALRFPARYGATSDIPAAQLLTDGPLLALPAGAVKVAMGAEYRKENANYALRGIKPGSRGGGVRLGRSIAAAFTELSIPLVGDANDARAVPKLELSLAGRYEHYSDFGQTFNPKIGLRWMPLAGIKLRASWGTSFKAATLADLDDTHAGSFMFSARDPLSPTGRSSVLAIAGSNADLKEERATTLTAGIDLAPTAVPGFQLSLTAYSIDYKDQVTQPGPAKNPGDVLLEEDQWASVVTRNPSPAQVDAVCSRFRFAPDPAQCRLVPVAAIFDGRLHNLASTKVTGLDFSLAQKFDTQVGYFSIGVDGSYVFHLKRAFTSTAPVVDFVDTVNNPLALRARGAVQWQQHREEGQGFAAQVSANYAGSYKNPDSPVRSSVDAWTTWDLGLSYRTGMSGDWMDATELAVNVVNVFDEDPPFVDWEWGHDFINARPEGRVISVSLSKRW